MSTIGTIEKVNDTTLHTYEIQGLKVFKGNEDVLKKIGECIPGLIKKDPISGITYYDSQENHVVFSSQSAQNLIFKFRKEEINGEFDFSMEVRFKNIEKARVICKTHELGLLIVPEAELVTINAPKERKYELLIETKLDIQPSVKYSPPLTRDQVCEVVRQLAVFILNTGFSDADARNIPLVKSTNTETDEFGIGIIDPEEMTSIYEGLFGGFKRDGLVGVFPKFREIVLNEVKKKLKINVINSSFQDVYKPDFSKYPKTEKRLNELANNLYSTLNIKKKLDGLIERQMNTQELFINVKNGIFRDVVEVNEDSEIHPMKFNSDQEYYDATEIGIVSNLFIKHGLIKEVSKRNPYGWWLVF